MAGEFLAKAQSFRERQRLPLRGSWQNRQVLTEGVRSKPSREKANLENPRLRSNESPSGAFKRQSGLR